MPPGDAERIRRYLCQQVHEAHRAGETRVTFRAGDVHEALGLENAYPNVCQVLKGEKFHKQAGVERVRDICRPPSGQGANLEIEFRILLHGVFEVRRYRDTDEDAIAALWTKVFRHDEPHNDPLVSIKRKTARDPDLFLVATEDSRVIGTVMGGYDGHRGWIYSLAVDERERHKGIGSVLMDKIEQELRMHGCLKVNLQVVGSNSGVIEFYKGIGFSVEDRVSMGKRLY